MAFRRFLLLSSGLSALWLTGCATTSLSNPGGSGHAGDLNIYELTGDDPRREVSERDIQSALSGRRGALPAKGARILLVQSGALQPDPELTAAFKQHAQVVTWGGRSSSGDRDSDDKKKSSGGAAGRKLCLVAAQQQCSHVVVVFGEIQSASRELATGALAGWVPVVGGIVPGNASGTRLLAQAIVMETARPRYTIIAADPREERGVTTMTGRDSANVRRSLRLKAAAYPELARKTFRQ